MHTSRPVATTLTRSRRLPARLASVLLAVAVLLSLTACNPDRPAASNGGGEDADRDTVRLAVGGQSLIVYLATTLAQQLGYYEEEGVDVEFHNFDGGSEALQALLGGSADVVSGFYDHTIQMAAQNQPLTAFVTMLRYPGLIVAVSPETDRPIQRVEDLQGAVVGVTAPGSSTHFFLNHLLVQAGLQPDDVSVQGIGTDATAVAAMERGRVDAAVMIEPAFSQLEARAGDLTILSDTRTQEGVREAYGTETYPASVLYTREGWLEDNTDTAAKLSRAITRTLAWIQEHSGEEIAASMPEEYAGDDPSLYEAAIENSKPMFSPDGRMDPEGAEAVLSVLRQSDEEVASADVDVARTFTNDLVGGG